MATKKLIKPKKKKVYTIGGLHFKTKALFDLYKELKEHETRGLINSFYLPTVEDEEKSKSKYGSKKCEIDGHSFDSIMEGRFYVHLLLEKQKGNVKEFELQPKFLLQESFKKNGVTIRAINYFADFLVTYYDGTKVVYDVKGRETTDFKIKRKMFDYKYRDLTLKLVQYKARTKSWEEV